LEAFRKNDYKALENSCSQPELDERACANDYLVQRQLETRIRHELPHLTEEDRCALARIIERLIDAYAPERIYLFGSKARGDYGPDSDFDLMVVVSDAAPVEQQRSRLAYEVLWGTGTAADVLVWTRGAFESRLHLAASLPATVMREWRLLHAA
jgi:predicted nucleotidyltransferase